MVAKEQDVVHAKSRIDELNNLYYGALNELLKSDLTNHEKRLNLLLKVQREANNYFNYCESFVGNSSLLGAHKDPLWAQGFAEDCLAILELMPKHYELLEIEFSKLEQSVNVVPKSAAYANMQRLAKKYIDHSMISDLASTFSASNLPTYGFEYEEKQFMSNKLQLVLSFSFGVGFLIVLLATTYLTPNPSSYQYTVFRIILALAGGGVVAVLPGFIEVKFGNWLRAGGALAVFAIIYLVSPAAMNVGQDIPNENPPILTPAKGH